MADTENELNPELSGNKVKAPNPPAQEPPDADPKGSTDPVDKGHNGNPAQTAARPSAQEANAAPAPLNEENPVTKEA